MPKRVLELWTAYYRLEPWGDEQYAASRLASMVSNLLASKCTEENASKVFKQEWELMPWNWVGRPDAIEQPDSIATFEKTVAARFGQ